MKTKVVLAYSGGLDTSVILKWLAKKGYEVIAYIADVGQQEDLAAVKQKALATGAKKAYVLDLREEFIEQYVFPALKAGAVYEGKYLLGTSLARPLIAKRQVEIAKQEGTSWLAHGCTGKGNDQVRFELAWMKFLPGVKIISPWKDPEWLSTFNGRAEMLAFAEKENIPVEASAEKPYSMDRNIMHISYESGILENLEQAPTGGMYTWTSSPQNAPDRETSICISFLKGIPMSVKNLKDGTVVKGSLKLFQYLNELGALNAIGRADVVENRIVGMKSRGVYETPAGTILMKAHEELESITLDKEVMHLKELLSPVIARLIYDGLWFSEELGCLMAAIEKSQEHVTGMVSLALYKGNIIVTARSSPCSLYNKALVSMMEAGGYSQEDAKGFITITGLRFKLGGRHEALDTKQGEHEGRAVHCRQ